MLKGIDENGNMRNVMVTEDGAVVVSQQNASGSTATPVEIQNENPIPVTGNVNVTNDITTLSAGVLTLSSTAQTISINKKVTELSIANYSESADITITMGQTSYVVGSNLAVDIPINKTVTSISLTSTESDTKVQYIVKGEE